MHYNCDIAHEAGLEHVMFRVESSTAPIYPNLDVAFFSTSASPGNSWRYRVMLKPLAAGTELDVALLLAANTHGDSRTCI